MGRRGKILTGALAVVVAAGVGGYWYERPLLLTATGYAAHNACALQHIAGRDHPETDLPPNPVVPLLRTEADGDLTQAVIAPGLASQTAHYTTGYGCAVADAAPGLPAPQPVDASRNPYSSAPTPAPDAETDAALARAFGDDLPADQQAALGTRAIVVLRDGQLVAERYAPGFTKDTPQLGWSMAKSVTSLTTGRLVQQGVVSLDDADLRPEWTDDRGQITVGQLLTMTSGLSWDETYDLGTPITRMLYLEPDMPHYVAAQSLAHPPGSFQQYSSGSTTLLCAVLADRAGVEPALLVRQQVIEPLGLASAVLETDATGNPVCSSYLWATPRDWAAIGQFALDDGVWQGERLLPEGWMTQTTTAVAADGEQEGYAGGWWANQLADGTIRFPTLPADTYLAQGHDGQRIVVVGSQRLVVVRPASHPAATTSG